MNKCKICGNEFTGKYCNLCGNEYKEDEKIICPECGAEVEEGSAFCNMCGNPLQNLEDYIISNAQEDTYYKQEPYVNEQNNEKQNSENVSVPFESSYGFDNKVIFKWVLYGLNWVFLVTIVCLLIFGKALYPSEESYRKNYMDYKYDGYTSRLDAGYTIIGYTERILEGKSFLEDSRTLLVTDVLVVFGIIFAISVLCYVAVLINSKGNREYETIKKGGIFFAIMSLVIIIWIVVLCITYNYEYGSRRNKAVITPTMIAVLVMIIVKLTVLIPQYVKACKKLCNR